MSWTLQPRRHWRGIGPVDIDGLTCVETMISRGGSHGIDAISSAQTRRV
jgi:hypothetical protein